MLFGCDVSNWQSQINWDLLGQVISFGAVKATEGSDWLDPLFHANWAQMARFSFPRIAYLFSRPFEGGDRRGRADALFFNSTVRGIARAGDIPAIDLEDEGPDQASRTADLGAYALDCVQTVESAFGVPPLIYSSIDYLIRHKINRVPELGRCGLWLADWETKAFPLPITPWKFWALWQYGSGPLPGVASSVDLNIFNGSVEQLRKYGIAS